MPRGLVYQRQASALSSSLYLARREGGVVRLWLRHAGGVHCQLTDVAAVHRWAAAEGAAVAAHVAHTLALAPPRQFAGLALDRPRLMGVVNVTPDSFSDGGRFDLPQAAVAHGLALAAAGADIIDVGGESTRPGAALVPVEVEIERILPVVSALAAAGLLLSIDTRRAAVMRAALDAGARIVNDVSALSFDAAALPLLAGRDAAVILMHMQGQPQDMQRNPRYDHVSLDVADALRARVEACVQAGIARDRLCLDPGIGFGKTGRQNCQLLNDLDLLHGLGLPLLLGVSRKSFIAALSRGETVDRRLPGSLAAALAGLQRGVQILRVHDIAETAQALAVWQGIGQAT